MNNPLASMAIAAACIAFTYLVGWVIMLWEMNKK